MALKSIFKRKRLTKKTGFHDYKRPSGSRRKPFKPKKTKLAPSDRKARKEAEKRGRIVTILKLITLLIVLGLAVYVLFFTRIFEIQKIEIKGDSDTLEEQAAVNAYLEDFLGKNLMFISVSKHEEILLDQYPYLKDLNIRRSLFHSLIVTLETYDNVTNILIKHEDGSKSYFIANELGYISIIGTTDESLPLIVMDVTATDVDLPESEESSLSINEEIIHQDTLETLLDAKKSFEAKFNMQVLEIHYYKQAREVHLFTERYFFVWIDLSQSVESQLSKLKKAMTQLNIYEADLDYIDLRISGQNGEKVIYKLTEEN